MDIVQEDPLQQYVRPWSRIFGASTEY